MGNAIGRGNRHLFLTFLWLELGAILVRRSINPAHRLARASLTVCCNCCLHQPFLPHVPLEGQ